VRVGEPSQEGNGSANRREPRRTGNPVVPDVGLNHEYHGEKNRKRDVYPPSMILRLRVYRLFFKFAVYLLAPAAFCLGWVMWRYFCALVGRPALYLMHGHLNHVLFGTLVWAFVSEHYRVTTFEELFRERTGARAATLAGTATAFVLLATLYFVRNAVFPRGLLVCDLFAILVLTILLHAVFRILYHSQASLAKPTRLLVVGADEFAHNAAKRLQRLSYAPFEVAGFVRLPGQVVQDGNGRVYEMEQLGVLNSSHGIDEAVIAIHPAQFSLLPKFIKAVEHLSVPVRAVVDLGEGIVVRERLFQLGNIQMLDLTSTPTESLDYAVLKRAFDICFSVGVLILLAPVFGLVALIIRLTSPGPVFFVQERVGLNGEPFRMYKFRTMREGPVEEGNTRWTTSGDPRRTRFGAFLRATSVDELPQFINVLRGEMSVVGPRPERPFFVREFLDKIARYNQRHALKVGITGWAQVNGWRGDTSIEKRVEFDLYYLQNWSFAFDLRIILMTLLSGLINRSAY
jgi:Undecaprenyl-phosphate glucose phosphotransferase